MSGARSRRDLEARIWPLTAEENCGIGLIGGALRPDLGLLAEEGRIVLLEALALHVGGHDTLLHALEPITDRVSWVQLALVTSVEEFTGVGLILGGCITHFILEELFLRCLEGWIVTYVLRHGGHGILSLTLLAASLLKLCVTQLLNFCIFFDTIELGIRLHHWLLLMLW